MAEKRRLVEPAHCLHNKNGSDFEPTDLWDFFFLMQICLVGRKEPDDDRTQGTEEPRS